MTRITRILTDFSRVNPRHPRSISEIMYNPLDLLVNDLVELTFDDEVGVYDVDQIMAGVVERDGVTTQTTRYFLQDVEAEEEDGDPLVLEIVEPQPDAAQRQFLFAITEAFEHDAEFVKLLDDDVFIIAEDDGDDANGDDDADSDDDADDGEHDDDDDDDAEAEEVEYRKTAYVTARVTTIDDRNEVDSGQVDIWRYQRDDEGDIWYLNIEIDKDDGWTTFYEGYELAEGEWQIARLSGDL